MPSPSVISGSNRIVPPLEPPVLSDLSNVPDVCHATRIAIGLCCDICSEEGGKGGGGR